MEGSNTRDSGAYLDYYDIAYGSCNVGAGLERSLGFKRIFLSGKEISIMEGRQKGGDARGSILVAQDGTDVLAALKMNPSAIVFADSRLDKKALEQMNERGVALCLPTSAITSSYGLRRSREIYLMGKLLKHALAIELEVSFATLARSNIHLCSYMQLIELAKMIGADEDYARESISSINKSLVPE